MIKLWRNIPDRLVHQFPIYKIMFMSIFVIFDIVANATAPNASTNANLSIHDFEVFVLYVGLSVASCFIVVPEIQRRLRSGHQWLGIQRTEKRSWTATVYAWVYPISIYLFIPAVLTFVTALASSLILSSDQSFAKSVSENAMHMNVWGSIGMSLLACTEEVWRWSMICIILVLLKRLFSSRWQSSAFQWAAMCSAIVLSSLFFGLGHVGEYPNHGWETLWSLSFTGLILMCCALVTRRFMVAMLIHFLYDFLVISQLNIPDAVFTVFGVCTFCVVLLFVVLFMVVRRRTNWFLHSKSLESFTAKSDITL